MSNTVFMKKNSDLKIEYESVLKTIPKDCFKEPQNLVNKVEIRWRFLEIPINKSSIKKVVEISRKKPDDDREYLDKNMKWTKSSVDLVFDQFVVESYYYYSDK